jgi:steroid delta-isomerase-like uncharacterized protein
MSTEQNKTIMRQFVNDTDLDSLKTLLATDFALHLADGPHNQEEFLQHLSYFYTAFSDKYFKVEEQIAEGDRVVTRGTWGGTHSGNFQGLPPTGKQIAISAVLFDRIEYGKIAEHRSQFDMLAMMQQLGLVPPPQPAS